MTPYSNPDGAPVETTPRRLTHDALCTAALEFAALCLRRSAGLGTEGLDAAEAVLDQAARCYADAVREDEAARHVAGG